MQCPHRNHPETLGRMNERTACSSGTWLESVDSCCIPVLCHSRRAGPAAGRRSAPATQRSGADLPLAPPAKANPKPETHITPDQAKQLFGLVDELLKFSSQETGLPIKSEVKRRLTTRAAVEAI